MLMHYHCHKDRVDDVDLDYIHRRQLTDNRNNWFLLAIQFLAELLLVFVQLSFSLKCDLTASRW